MPRKLWLIAAVIGLTAALTPAAAGTTAKNAATWQTVANSWTDVQEPRSSYANYGAALVQIATHLDHLPAGLRVIVKPKGVHRHLEWSVTCFKNANEKTKSGGISLEADKNKAKLRVPNMSNPHSCLVYVGVNTTDSGFTLDVTLQERT